MLFLALVGTLTNLTSAAATLPNGYTETLIASGLDSPTAMAFAPDGRLFVCEQSGQLRVVKNGSLLGTPFLNVTVDRQGERGLLGVAFDPNFPVNHFVYVYYTATSPAVHNRVSRFTANGDVAVAGSEMVILNLNNLSGASNHNGGAIHFGSDGKLYISVGENANSANSQTLANLLGKMLRLNPDGTIPTDNPFYDAASGVNRAIWALGLRNPFTFAVQPGTGRMFINDVGEDTWEEINEAVAGSNYGWPNCEGDCSPMDPEYRDPLFRYDHGGASWEGNCITGGDFYNPTTLNFPASAVGTYFFADYVNGWIHQLDPANGNQVSGFATGINAPVDLKVGSDGRLYYLAYGSGAVFAISYTGSESPQITQSPADLTVAAGQAATFTVSASGTPPLGYQWQRDGLDISGATDNSYTVNFATLADDGAAFRCVVSNDYGTATSVPAVLSVKSGSPPVGTINSPATGTFYNAGDTILFSGTGTDVEDGDLPASAFSWTIVFHHDTHTHPFLGPIDGVTSGSFVIPTQGETSPNVWYRVHLTVTDSTGQAQTSYRDVLPHTATISLTTSPPGLQVTLDGQPLTTPALITNVVGITRTLGIVSPQSQGGTGYQFTSWSDGGAASHTINAPSASTNYTATYQAIPPALTFTTANVPDGMENTTYATTLTASGGTPPYSWSVNSGSLPGGLALDSDTGTISGTPTAAGSFNFTAHVIDAGSPAQSVSQALNLTVAMLPDTSGGILGNTNEGTFTDTIGVGWINAGRFQASENLTATNIYAKVVTMGGDYQCALYTDSAGQPGRLLAASAAVSHPNTGWQTFALSTPQALTNGQYYWLAISSDDAAGSIYYFDMTGTLRWGQYPYGAWPDPLLTTAGGNANYCIYAQGQTVVIPALNSILVTPANPGATVGDSLQFTATGTYSDGSNEDLTGQAIWTSSDADVATITAAGLATAAAVGDTTVTAAWAGVSGNTTLTISAIPLVITTSGLPDGMENTTYATMLEASGGTPPYSWSVVNGSLPGGLALDSNSGVINGTPIAAGTFNFTTQVTDAGIPAQSVSQTLNLAVAMLPNNLDDILGNTNEGTLTDTIGAGWINAGRFQANCNLTASNICAKVVAISGGYQCAIYGDSAGQPSQLLETSSPVNNPATGWQTFSLTTPQALTNGQYYWLAISSDNVGGKIYYSDTMGTLRWGRNPYGNWPDPLVTTASGDANYCVYATGMAMGTPVLTALAVTPANPDIGVGGTLQFSATGMYSDGSTQNLTSQATWMSSNPDVAMVSEDGMAEAACAGNTMVAAAWSGVSGSTILTVPAVPVAITTSVVPDGMENTTYATTLTASGGTPPYSWSVNSGSLPGGLALDSDTGTISGTPTAAGSFNFTAHVIDAGSPAQSVSQALNLTVAMLPDTSGGILGNTNEGTFTDTIGVGWINAGRFQASENLTATNIYAKVVTMGGDYQCALYTDSAGQPGRLLAASAAVSHPNTGWQTFALSTPQALTNGQYYWLAISSDDAAGSIYYFDMTGTLRWGQYPYGAWPDPLLTTAGGNANYCIYAAGSAISSSVVVTPASPVITSISLAGDVVTITWSTVEGRTYVLESADNPGQINWSPVWPSILATGPSVTATNAVDGNSPQRFYRVRLDY